MPCPKQSRDVRGGGRGGGKGREFELSTSVWRPGLSGCNMTWARGQNVWAKVTSPPANGVWAGPMRPGAGIAPPWSAPLGSQRFSEGEEAPRRKRAICRGKIKARRSPLASLRSSVDNLSWSLSSEELCSRALGQDPGSRPPEGRRAWSRSPGERPAGTPGHGRRSDWCGEAQASPSTRPARLLRDLGVHSLSGPPGAGALLPPPVT